MSWQEYVDNNLIGSNHLAHAAIFGLDGAQWATSPGFSVKPEEAKELIAGFTNSESIQANGIHLAGTKYMFLRSDDAKIYAKKNSEGACIAKSKKAILIGAYKEGTQPGNANQVVEGLADYLISVNF